MNDVKHYERKCKNWLQSFIEWTAPRSEAPETFIAWTGLYTLAAALRRHVKLPKNLLGSWDVSPNLYILFIAPAGRARKSTTANYAEDLLDELPNITKSPEIITKEDLLNKLTKSSDSSMYIIAPEFGEFIVKSGTTMFGFLTNMFDGKKNISSSTLLRGAEFAEKPCINLIGATTPEWIAENMPESVIGGGFASRVIFIFEEKVRRRKLFYDDLDWEKINTIRMNLVSDLIHIASNIKGDYSLTKDAYDFMENWYRHTSEEGSEKSYKLSGYYERRPAHVIKTAILLHTAYSDSMVLEKIDFESAIKLISELEERLPKVFEHVGKNPHTVDMTRIYEYIVGKGEIKLEDVKRQFIHAATPSMLKDLIDGLVGAGYISMRVVGMDVMLKPNTNGTKVRTEIEVERSES